MSGLFTEVSVRGLEAIKAKLERLGEKEPVEDLREAMTVAAFAIQREAKASIQKSDTNPVTGHSFPGSPPHTQTGRLVNSIYVKTLDSDPKSAKIMVGTDLVYGRHLEFGTVNMAARPWLGRAMSATRKENTATIKQAVIAGLKKVAKLKIGGGR
jgi:HK97 gp10 family phage protein